MPSKFPGAQQPSIKEYQMIYRHPQLPFKEPQIPSNRDHKSLNKGTLGGLGRDPKCELRHQLRGIGLSGLGVYQVGLGLAGA